MWERHLPQSGNLSDVWTLLAPPCQVVLKILQSRLPMSYKSYLTVDIIFIFIGSGMVRR